LLFHIRAFFPIIKARAFEPARRVFSAAQCRLFSAQLVLSGTPVIFVLQVFGQIWPAFDDHTPKCRVLQIAKIL
jgi:hypothetical protein